MYFKLRHFWWLQQQQRERRRTASGSGAAPNPRPVDRPPEGRAATEAMSGSALFKQLAAGAPIAPLDEDEPVARILTDPSQRDRVLEDHYTLTQVPLLCRGACTRATQTQTHTGAFDQDPLQPSASAPASASASASASSPAPHRAPSLSHALQTASPLLPPPPASPSSSPSLTLGLRPRPTPRPPLRPRLPARADRAGPGPVQQGLVRLPQDQRESYGQPCDQGDQQP